MRWTGAAAGGPNASPPARAGSLVALTWPTRRHAAELRTAYEAAAHENQRLSGSLAELSRELQARDTGACARVQRVGGGLWRAGGWAADQSTFECCQQVTHRSSPLHAARLPA